MRHPSFVVVGSVTLAALGLAQIVAAQPVAPPAIYLVSSPDGKTAVPGTAASTLGVDAVRAVVAPPFAAGLLSTSPHLDALWDPRARVQLAPLCNVLTLSVAEDDRGLAAAGSDDRCGVGTPTPVSGRALRNADGTLRMALYVHDGREVQLVSLQLDVTGRVGTWHDTAGRAGVAAPPGTTARRRPSRGGQFASASHDADGKPVDIVPADPPNGPGSNFFRPEFPGFCTYGRQFLDILASEVICSDVITPVPFGAVDMTLGSDGNPVFVGPGASGAGVVVTQCGNPACSAGNTPVPLSATASGGRIAIGLDGLPVVAMVSAGTVTVTKCGDLGCTSGIESTVSTAGLSFSLVIGSDGLPLVVGSLSSGLVRVIHCGDAACTSGNTAVDLQLPNATAAEPKVAIAPTGLPVIAFHYEVPLPPPQADNGVKLHFCADLTCSTGSTSSAVMRNTNFQTNKFCCGLSLAVGIDGLPIVASHRMFWGLWVAHCNDGACSSSTSGSKNDDMFIPGISVDLLIGAHGVPVMSHHGGNDSTLRVTECRDVACTGFDHPTRTIDVGATNGANVLGNEGLPIVAYFVAGGARVVGCGTKGCQMPAQSLSPRPMSLPPQAGRGAADAPARAPAANVPKKR